MVPLVVPVPDAHLGDLKAGPHQDDEDERCDGDLHSELEVCEDAGGLGPWEDGVHGPVPVVDNGGALVHLDVVKQPETSFLGDNDFFPEFHMRSVDMSDLVKIAAGVLGTVEAHLPELGVTLRAVKRCVI